MAKSVDYKKLEKEYYIPSTTPSIITIPKMKFIMIDGEGNPNTSQSYKDALEVLYGLSYAIKMSKMSGNQPDGYFDYVVPPLEGYWSIDDGQFNGINGLKKDKFTWTSFIRQPEFVNQDVFEQAKVQLKKKKPNLDLSKCYFGEVEEGLCAQVMHIGSYDNEPETIRKLVEYVQQEGYEEDFTTRRHHEIYLGDPRKTKPEKLKTVIRHPVKKV
ncbi:GyrI-like domain-containing protein [Anaerorhabdus sp.]|uniref:GyrI-like domain-containing protein n=1 Tax=Anaerorhabdus sp. TaxID=1872524 RepID=UPI002FC87509